MFTARTAAAAEQRRAAEARLDHATLRRAPPSSGRRAASNRHRAAKAALMAQPRTNTYLRRKQRARLAVQAAPLEPEPEPEPPQDSVSLWRAAQASGALSPTQNAARYVDYPGMQVGQPGEYVRDSSAANADEWAARHLDSAVSVPASPTELSPHSRPAHGAAHDASDHARDKMAATAVETEAEGQEQAHAEIELEIATEAAAADADAEADAEAEAEADAKAEAAPAQADTDAEADADADAEVSAGPPLMESPVVSVEHSKTDIAVAELRRQQASLHQASIGASGIPEEGSDDDDYAGGHVDVETTGRNVPAQRSSRLGSTSLQASHSISSAVEQLRRARDTAWADRTALNDDASPWRPLQPGARMDDTRMGAGNLTLPEDLREMVSAFAAEEAHRCVSVETESVKEALKVERERAEAEVAARQEMEAQLKHKVAEAVAAAVTDEQARHKEETTLLRAEHAEQAAQLRQERQDAHSRCSDLAAEMRSAQADLLAVRAEARTLTKQLSETDEVVASSARAAASEVKALEAKLSTAEPAVLSLQREREELQASAAAERRAAGERLADTETQLQALQQEMKQQEALLAVSRTGKDAAEAETAKQAAAAAAAAEAAEAVSREAVQAELEAKLATSQQEAENYARDKEALQAELKELRNAEQVRNDQQDEMAKAQHETGAAAAATKVHDEEAPSMTRSDSRSRRLNQMRRHMSVDSGAAQMSNHVQQQSSPPSSPGAQVGGMNMSADWVSGNTSGDSRSASPLTNGASTSPSAARARDRAERNWHLAHSLQQVQSLRRHNGELELQLRKARRELAEQTNLAEQNEAGGPADDDGAAEAAEALTEATARVKEEVIATAEEQTRVMEKLRWIEQALLHRTKQKEGGRESDTAAMLPPPPPRAPSVIGDDNAEATAAATEPVATGVQDRDQDFPPQTEEAIVNSLEASIGVTLPG